MVTDAGHRSLSPTDISRFVLLEQCQRFLKLRLREKNEGSAFLDAYGVATQQIPPLMSRSGRKFEQAVELSAEDAGAVTFLRAADRRREGRSNDNDRLVDLARALPNDAVRLVFQPRLEATLNGWELRGDVDIVRLERTPDGQLQILIADMKSSAAPKIDHRLQVAFYHQMLRDIVDRARIDVASIELGILYRGPADGGATFDDAARARLLAEAHDAADTFGIPHAYLQRISDPEPYLWSVHDLVTGSASLANRVLALGDAEVPFHLTSKCDGCVYNEYCMKWAAETENLSLLPSITEQHKSALEHVGITTVRQLAGMKQLEGNRLVDRPEHAELNRRLAGTWPVGPRYDELIHRARQFRRFRDTSGEALTWIPAKGKTSLPYCAPDHNPNLVRIYVDAQFDHLHDRLYMLGALVTGCEGGEPREARRRSIVRVMESSPTLPQHEEALVLDWLSHVLQAIVDVAAPDENGEAKAPLHIVFYNSYAQRVLLEALARHSATIFGATAIYDFVTQIPGLESPVASYLDRELQRHRNLPMVTQSLQAVAAYLGFDWGASRQQFRSRHFDFWRKLDEERIVDGETAWYFGRARFNSQIPLEYAYAAWQELPDSDGDDDFASFRHVTIDDLRTYQERRLQAIEHIAGTFRGNEVTRLSPFVLPDLATFEQRSHTLAQALDEFLTIERHIDLADWKQVRLAAPEDRTLSGTTLVARFVEADQDEGVAEQNAENQRRHALREEYRAAFRAANPGKSVRLPKDQAAEVKWDHGDLIYRLRIDAHDLACSLDEVLRINTFRPGARVIMAPRQDSWMPDGEIVTYTPTAKSLLSRPRVEITGIDVERDDAGRAMHAWVRVKAVNGSGSDGRGFTFGYGEPAPFEPDRLYTLDIDINDPNGRNLVQVVEGLVAGGYNRLYELLTPTNPAPVSWPSAAQDGQRRFLDGLDALRDVGAMHGFEPDKRRYIAETGAEPLLLVQGPPGTGKSYSTSLALLARIQGAMAADMDFRVLVSSKTHAAIDVLLANVLRARDQFIRLRKDHPAIFERYFDARLEDIGLFRMAPRTPVDDGIAPLYRAYAAPKGHKPVEMIEACRWAVVGSTPSGVWGMVTDHARKNEFATKFIDCVVMDEASQMNLPEAMASCLPVRSSGQVIVVGDPRQMPPIVKNDWDGEARRTFQEFRAFASLFEAARERNPATIRFAESFRLHRDMAKFLRDEIYIHDGIDFHSNRIESLEEHSLADDFVAAVLDPGHALTVVVHDEAASLKRNEYEQELMRPVLETLVATHRKEARRGLGVVVPHTSQRVGLLEAIGFLTTTDPETATTVEAVNTVERYQGDERDVIIFSATESDPAYIQMAGEFMLNPRRLTVALSRAKQKMILIASTSIFEMFSGDEETFNNAQLWKNLLRKTCTQELWRGERDGHTVTVWGNAAADD